MKSTTRLRILFLLFMVFNMTIINAQDGQTIVTSEESKKSFNEVFKNFNFNNSSEATSSKDAPNCKQTLLNESLKHLPDKLTIKEDTYQKLIKILVEIDNLVDDVIEKHDLETKLSEGTAFGKVSAKDKILGAFHTTRFKSNFIKKVKTRRDKKNVDWEKEDDLNEDIGEIYNLINYSSRIRISTSYPDVEGCNQVVSIMFLSIDTFLRNEIIIKGVYRLALVCECPENSTNSDIKYGAVNYYRKIKTRLPDEGYDLRNLIFTTKGSTEYKITDIECCPAKEGDKDDTPKEDNEEPKDENDDPKDDKEDFMPNEEGEDCCTSEDPKQTIGFVPGFGLTNNFEDFSYDLGIEYLRNIGDSFGDNSLYAGALVGYMGENRQDGEVKETMWYAAGIIQNRSPFSFCDDLQWINQICVLYGEGQIDAFGNTDDFSTFSVGVHTGFNFQFNDKFAVGADVTVASIGSTTFTSENGGSEFKQDIGNLFVNKRNGVRFGFRFTF